MGWVQTLELFTRISTGATYLKAGLRDILLLHSKIAFFTGLHGTWRRETKYINEQMIRCPVAR